MIPDDLENIEACFSPGVGQIADFEEDMANRGIRSYMVDYSVESPLAANRLFCFERKDLADVNDHRHIRLEDWVKNNTSSKQSDLLLQMDIEGMEFSVLLDTPVETLKRFRVMVIEFHKMQLLFSSDAFRFVNQVFKKLISEFAVVHIHPNNYSPVISRGKFDIPDVIEVTFHRQDRVHKSARSLIFPHPLDAANKKENPDIVLPPCWR